MLQAEFSTSRDRIEGVTVSGLRGSRGKEMKPRFVFVEDILEGDVYSKELFKEAIRQHFNGYGYKTEFVWFSNYTFFD